MGIAETLGTAGKSWLAPTLMVGLADVLAFDPNAAAISGVICAEAFQLKKHSPNKKSTLAVWRAG
jgi:hypothetical protein